MPGNSRPAASLCVPCDIAVLETLRSKARVLKQDTLVLYLAVRDRRTPSYARATAGRRGNVIP